MVLGRSLQVHPPPRALPSLPASRASTREAVVGSSDSIIPREPFRPFIEDDGKPTGTAKAPSSIPLVDTLGDSTVRDIAYHSLKVDREMWPTEV